MVAKRRHRQVPLIKIEDLDVRFGSKADMCSAMVDVRYAPKADMVSVVMATSRLSIGFPL